MREPLSRDQKFTFYIHRDYTARLFPWWGTMAHGIGNVGGPGEGVWRARSRERLVEKMSRAAGRIHKQWGCLSEPRISCVENYEES